MTEGAFSFEVGREATVVSVKDWDALLSWLEKEHAKWAWLQRGGETDLPNQWASNVQNQWEQLLNTIRHYQMQGNDISFAGGALQPLSAGGQLLVSTSADGIQVLDIRASAGDVCGAFAYAFIKGAVEWSTVRRADALLGILLTVLPDMREPAEMHVALKAERKKFQDSLRSGMARVGEDFKKREAAFDALVERGTGVALKTLRKRTEEWKGQQSVWGKQALDAVAEINGVKDAYLQFMQLQAPVEYWSQKSAAHNLGAGKASTRLVIYFAVLLVVLGLAFGKSAEFLLTHTPPPNTSSTPLYLVISGGLVVLSTVGFWIGRLFTKLYLSEHHLRTDADERAVMTKTYLALTKEGSATEAERQIILSALFRSSSDGIVRDDGPPDVGLQAMISKAMAK